MHKCFVKVSSVHRTALLTLERQIVMKICCYFVDFLVFWRSSFFLANPQISSLSLNRHRTAYGGVVSFIFSVHASGTLLNLRNSSSFVRLGFSLNFTPSKTAARVVGLFHVFNNLTTAKTLRSRLVFIASSW